MVAVRRFCLGSSLLALCVLGCHDEPLAPDGPLFAMGGSRVVLAPSNFTATALSSSHIDVAWQDNSDNEGGFEVWVAVTGVSTFNLWTTTGPNVTKASFTGIGAEKEYCAKARGFMERGKSANIGNYSDFSNIACASTALPPSVPLWVNATPLNSNAVAVSWSDNSNNEDGFRVERSVDGAATWTIVGTTKGFLNYFQDYGLTSEQPVCHRVIAFNSHGDSPPSAADCTTPPAAPNSLTATGVAAPAIDLTWTDNSVVEGGYEVLRSPDDFYSFAVIATLPANSTAYHDAAVSGNARYWYAVRATKDNGYSSRSNTANALAATTPPNAPAGTDAIPMGSSGVQVTWFDNSANEDGFRVERSLDGGASWAVAGTRGPLDYPYSQGWFGDPDRPSDQQVCYRILAFNGLGDSPPSNTDCTAPPAAPTGLVATTATGLAIDLTWIDNSSVEDGYEVQQFYCIEGYEEPYCDYEPFAPTLGPNVTSYRHVGLAPSSYYTYRVVALKDGGRSDASNDASAFSEFPPAAPSNLTATAVSSGQIDLAWTENSSSAQYFTIERCVGDAITCGEAGFVQIAWGTADVTTFSDVGVQAGTTYTYRVRFYSGGQFSEPSNAATATTP